MKISTPKIFTCPLFRWSAGRDPGSGIQDPAAAGGVRGTYTPNATLNAQIVLQEFLDGTEYIVDTARWGAPSRRPKGPCDTRPEGRPRGGCNFLRSVK